ncbi:MAG TPA: XRE family transcriptional regulator [Clostridiales bacterium]|nr:XRE family transcriptional regulator [Clostridiales bacterium]
MFKDVLRDLMKEKGINQKELSINAGIPQTTISGWMCAGKLPDYSGLIKLAEYFEVSADVLLEIEK